MLEEFPTTQINIDLKDQEEALIRRVEEVIKAHGAENRWFIYASADWTLRYICSTFFTDASGAISVSGQQKNVTRPIPLLAFFSLCLGFLTSLLSFFLLKSWKSFLISIHGRFVKLYLLFYTGLLPFVPLKETHLEIPMPSIFYDNNYRLFRDTQHIQQLSSEHLGPMLDSENYPCGLCVWRTMSWWVLPFSIISTREEFTLTFGCWTRKRSLPGINDSLYGSRDLGI